MNKATYTLLRKVRALRGSNIIDLKLE